MTRRLPPPWHADKFSGGYVVRDANGFAVAYVYGRSTEAEALEAKQMTTDEARRVASNIAKATGHVEARGISRTSCAWNLPGSSDAGHFSQEAKAEQSRLRAALLALRDLCDSI
jgi:hypothetical protein